MAGLQQYRTVIPDIAKAKHAYMKSTLSVRRILQQSINEELRSLYKITSVKNIRPDSLVNTAIQSNPDQGKHISSKFDRLSTKTPQVTPGKAL